jgi:hypothetical protein
MEDATTCPVENVHMSSVGIVWQILNLFEEMETTDTIPLVDITFH